MNKLFSGMEAYMSINETISSSEGKEDPITFEDLNLLKPSSHPRGSMSIRRDNGTPYFYNVETIIKLIEKSDGKDPFTRKKFDAITIERAYLYNSCIQNFPDLKKEEIDCKAIYLEWMADPTNSMKLLKAQCLLQPSDLLGIFRAYNGKGSVSNREEAIADLTNSGDNTWLLRNASVKDTETRKGYCISMKINGEIYHHLIVHKIGSGVYSSAMLEREQEIPENFEYGRVFPSIIHLINCM
jgi:hypothetical protein